MARRIPPVAGIAVSCCVAGGIVLIGNRRALLGAMTFASTICAAGMPRNSWPDQRRDLTLAYPAMNKQPSDEIPSGGRQWPSLLSAIKVHGCPGLPLGMGAYLPDGGAGRIAGRARLGPPKTRVA